LYVCDIVVKKVHVRYLTADEFLYKLAFLSWFHWLLSVGRF